MGRSHVFMLQFRISRSGGHMLHTGIVADLAAIEQRISSVLDELDRGRLHVAAAHLSHALDEIRRVRLHPDAKDATAIASIGRFA